jgi:hypothetical protein
VPIHRLRFREVTGIVPSVALSLGLAMQPAGPSDAAVPQDAFALRWDAPPECPREADVRAAIERHLAATLESPRGDGLRVDAVARVRDDGRWRVELVVEGGEGRSERVIGGTRDCAEAVETAALVVAIAIDPDVALRDPNAVVPAPTTTTTTPTTTTTTTTTPTPTTTTTTTPTSTSTKRPRLQLRGAVGVRGEVGGGTMPSVAGGGTLFVDLLIGARGRVGVGASITGAPTLQLDGDASARFLRWTVEVRGCPVFAVRRWLEVVPCVGVQAGETRVDVRGLANERDPRHPWAAPLAQVAVVFVPIRAVGVWVGAYGLVPVTRQGYEVVNGDETDVVHETAPVAGGALVGIEARFP